MFYFFIFLHKVSAGARPKKEKKHSPPVGVFLHFISLETLQGLRFQPYLFGSTTILM